MVLERKTCFPVTQILRKYPILSCLNIFTYLRSIVETLPFYCQPALSISECHFVIAEVTQTPTTKSLLMTLPVKICVSDTAVLCLAFFISINKFVAET